MKAWQITCIIAAFAIFAIYQIVAGNTPSAAPRIETAEANVSAESPAALALAFAPDALPQRDSLLLPKEQTAPDPADMTAAIDLVEKDQARLEEDHISSADYAPDPTPAKQDLSYLVYYAYAELPPAEKPADTVLGTLKNTPVGTPLEEIKRASDAFGLDFGFMKAVAKIESGFDPKQRTGSYIGLFQLSKYEFGKYGSGDIINPRDNAIAAAYKFLTEGVLFAWETHKSPTFSDLYLIHQQGWQGAAEHVGHPERIAWQSMCATDEGRDKGEKWCKRAIWGNTLPAVKQIWKSVDKLTSAAFVSMWRERVEGLYSRYSEATVGEAKR